MRVLRSISTVLMPIALIGVLGAAQPQGKGYGGGKKAEKAQSGGAKQERGKGAKAIAKADRGQARAAKVANRQSDKPKALGQSKSKVKDVREVGGSVERTGFRTFAVSKKRGERLVGYVVANALARGVSDDALVIVPVGRKVQVLNRSGVILLDLDDDRELGSWKAVSVRDRGAKGSPSFCRSGAGHPVWGRQWCVDKGFGLGDEGDVRWVRVIEPGDVVVHRRDDPGGLTRVVLADILGDIVLNRLATHAITLGLVEPLTGTWLGEPNGPHVLLLTSGDQPVAEVVDVNRDGRADVLLVAQRRW